MGELNNFIGKKCFKMRRTWMFGLDTEKFLSRFCMQAIKPVSTPVDISVKIIKAPYNAEHVDQQLHRSAIGSLL